jgi:DNA-binding beta-propeller fold protein YncE
MAGLTGMASAEEPERVLFDAGTLTVSGVDSSRTIGADIREIRFDPRDGAETVYALSRRPEALLIADIPSAGSSRLEIRELVDVGIGPSRLALASLRGRLFAFVSCFDSRDLYVIDLDDGRLSGVVRGMSGPFTLSVDESRERLYVADFGASVIRVVGLSTLLSCLDGAGAVGDSCAPLIEATIGEPRPVRELQ